MGTGMKITDYFSSRMAGAIYILLYALIGYAFFNLVFMNDVPKEGRAQLYWLGMLLTPSIIVLFMRRKEISLKVIKARILDLVVVHNAKIFKLAFLSVFFVATFEDYSNIKIDKPLLAINDFLNFLLTCLFVFILVSIGAGRTIHGEKIRQSEKLIFAFNLVEFFYYSYVISYAIKVFGNDILKFIDANSPAVILCLVLLVLIVKIQSNLFQPRTYSGSSEDLTSGAARKIHVIDKKTTAVHEAGHAMAMAALGFVPVGYKLVILDEIMNDGTHGFVSGIQTNSSLSDKEFMEWQMLMLLSGIAAEKEIFGKCSSGGISDYEHWQAVANSYCINQFAGYYEISPKNSEILINQRFIKSELQERHFFVLKEFFDINRNVLEKLYQRALREKTLSDVVIAEILKDVVVTESFAMPFGRGNKFSTIPENKHGVTIM